MARNSDRQRPCVSRGGRQSVGNQLSRTEGCVLQPARRDIRQHHGGIGFGSEGVPLWSWYGARRSVQQWSPGSFGKQYEREAVALLQQCGDRELDQRTTDRREIESR